jgi:hypothetical protein
MYCALSFHIYLLRFHGVRHAIVQAIMYWLLAMERRVQCQVDEVVLEQIFLPVCAVLLF